MTQDQCLSLPSHWTHDGTCFAGANANIQITGLTTGGTSGTSTPVAAPE